MPSACAYRMCHNLASSTWGGYCNEAHYKRGMEDEKCLPSSSSPSIPSEIVSISSSPARMGEAWGSEEIMKLLQSVKQKKTHDIIAKEHQRTHGAITSKLRSLAYDYYEEGKNVDQIQIITGLSKEQIADSIAKHEASKALKEMKNKKKEEQKKYLFYNQDIRNVINNKSTEEKVLESLDRIEKLLERLVQQGER